LCLTDFDEDQDDEEKVINESDDEDLDDDAAFDSEDERLYGHLYNGNSKRGGKIQEGGSSDDEEDDDEDYEGGMALSDMLDMPDLSQAENKKEKNAKVSSKSKKKAAALDDDDEEEEEEEDGFGGNQGVASALSKLTQKRASKSAERTEAIAETEYGTSLSSGLTMNALLGSLKGTDDYDKVHSKVSKLDRADALIIKPTATSTEKRVTRQVAYESAKEELKKWLPIVKKNREAETLHFGAKEMGNVKLSNAELTSKFTPQNDLEKNIAQMLQESGCDETSAYNAEGDELAENEVTMEEIKSRRDQISKMKALMFYQEQKQKRTKKIKSKLFHKIRNKQAERSERLAMEELREVDPEAAAALEEKGAKDRIMERMTLKHKNNKWIKHAMKMGDLNDDTRIAVSEQFQLEEKLRRKMNTMADGDDSDDSDGGDDERQVNPFDAAKSSAASLLDEIDGDDDVTGKHKGIFKLKFMQRSIEKQRKEARLEAAALLEELESMEKGTVAVNDEENEGRIEPAKKKTRSSKTETKAIASEVASMLPTGSMQIGDLSFNTSQRVRASGVINLNGRSSGESDAAKESPTLAVSAAPVVKDVNMKASIIEAAKINTAMATSSNPWLTESDNVKHNKKRTHLAMEESNTVLDVSKRLKSLDKGNGESKEVVVLHDSGKKGDKKAKSKKEEVKDIAQYVDDESHSVDGDDAAAPLGASISQESLIKRAFVDANVDEEFEKEKSAIIEQDAPKPQKELKGWGSWTGLGAKEAKQQKFVIDKKAKPAAPVQPRKDANLKSVIINEKRDKKVAKYLIDAVPYPFTSREQYERSIRAPVGKEWNTTNVHEKMVKPSVIVRPGTIINPIKYTKGFAKMNEEVEKLQKAKSKNKSRSGAKF
jgi:U3 small nucleolar RNA-associated protein 14